MLPSLLGSSFVRSRVLRLIDGVTATLSCVTVIDAPVRPAFSSASFSAVTVTPSSVTAARFSLKSTLDA
jgi:precorrin-3B methylase